MFATYLLSIILIVMTCSVTIDAAMPAVEPIADFRLRHAPGESASAILARLHKALARESTNLAGRSTTIKNSTSFEKSWDNAVLFKASAAGATISQNGGSVSATIDAEIVCTTCYIKSDILAQLTVAGDFNATEALDSARTEFTDDVANLTQAVKDTAQDILHDVATGNADFTDIAFPTMDFDFDRSIGSIPEISVQLQFDNTELYAGLDVILSAGATYTLHLYSSKTPVGFEIGKQLELGLILNVDLILSVESEIDISSGFHLALDDGLQLNLDLFGSNVSDIVFPGGRFEFLPVTIATEGVTLHALLRLRVDLGLAFATSSVTFLNESFSAGAGIEGSVFANVAEFVTNITLPQDGESECSLEVEEYYQFAVGAAVGATVYVGDDVWGPMPSTTVPVFHTTLASVCAESKTQPAASTIPTSSQLGRRFDLFGNTEDATSATSSATGFSTATITTETTYIVQSCKISGLLDCPASQVATVTFDTTLSITTTVPSGVDPTWPASTYSTITSTVQFGSRAHKIGESEGPATSYSQGPVASFINKETGGVPRSTVLGVSLGLGLPALLAVAAGCFYFLRRHQKKRNGIQYEQAANEDPAKDEHGEELNTLDRSLLK